MNKTIKSILAVLAVIFMLALICVPAFAANEEATAPETTVTETEETADSAVTTSKAISAAIVVGLAAAAGAIAMAISIKSASDGMARQPEAAGNIRSSMMLGLVFIETAIIYALIVAILVIFVL